MCTMFLVFSRPFPGLGIVRALPGVKRRAILGDPFGMRSPKSFLTRICYTHTLITDISVVALVASFGNLRT